MPHVDARHRCVGLVLSALLTSLAALLETPGGSLAAEDDAPVTREWEALRGDLRRDAKRIARVDTSRDESAGGGRAGGNGHATRGPGAILQSNFRRIDASLTAVAEAVAAMSTAVQESGVSQKLARSEDAVREADERLRARWERERAARERERAQREREAGERARARP